MLGENLFSRSDEFPSWFANAIQKLLSVSAYQFQVIATDGTHIKVPAGAGDQATAIAIEGLWRWSESDVGPVAHPGGAQGSYPAFVTCKNNSIVATPLPDTDATDRSFALQIKPPGSTPTIVPGTVDQYRHVADLQWDGSQIVQVTPILPGSQPRLFPYVASSGNWNVVDRTAVTAAPNSIVNLPTCNAYSQLGRLVKVQADATVTPSLPVRITPLGGALIQGAGLPAVGVAAAFLGAPHSFVWLLAEAINVWKIVAGALDSGWVALARATNVNAGSGNPPAARVIGDGSALRGELVNGTGAALVAGNTWATVPSGAFPAFQAQMGSVANSAGSFLATMVQVALAGAITSSVNVASGGTLFLDNLGYPLVA